MANLSGEAAVTVVSRVYIPSAAITGTRRTIFSAGNAASADGLVLRVANDNKWEAYWYDGSNYPSSKSAGVASEGWHNVAGVYDCGNSIIGIYLDGVYSTVAATAMGTFLDENCDPFDAMRMGALVDGAWPWLGEIQLVEVYSGAMTSVELDDYFAGLGTARTRLHAWNFANVVDGSLENSETAATHALTAGVVSSVPSEFRTPLAELNPLHYYPLTEWLGQGLMDASPRGAHGSATGGPALTIDGVLFDGVDDYVELALADLFPTYSYYLEVAPDAVTIGQAFIGQHPATGTPNTEMVGLYDGGVGGATRIVGSAAGSTPASYPVDATQHFTAGEYTKILRTVDASTPGSTVVKLYVDGVEVDSQTYAAGVSAHEGLPWVIGQEWDSGPTASDHLAGKIKHVALFDRVLDSAEVAAVFGLSAEVWDEATLTDASHYTINGGALEVPSPVQAAGRSNIAASKRFTLPAASYEGYYFEIVVDADGGDRSKINLGFLNSASYDAGSYETSAFGWSGPIYGNDLVQYEAVIPGTIAVGDVIGVCVYTRSNLGTVTASRNGSFSYPPTGSGLFTIAGATSGDEVVILAGLHEATSPAAIAGTKITLRTKASEFSHAPPANFVALDEA